MAVEASAWSSPRVAPVLRDGLAALLGVLAPLLLLALLLTQPSLDVEVEAPVQHFYIVSAVSLVALAFAVLVAIGALQGRAYRSLFLAFGFTVMAGLFTVHALSTPGVFGPEGNAYSARSVTSVSAFLSLLVPAGFVALSYTTWPTRLERRLPFAPAGLATVLAVGILVSVAALGVANSALVAGLPFASPPLSFALGEAGVLLFGFAAWRQIRIYLLAQLRLQLTLAAAFLLLAEAQVAMVITEVWTVGWWLYHLLMLAAVAIALRALALERLSGRRLARVVEQALDLPAEVDVSIEDTGTIGALAAAVELKDATARGHNRRVAQLSVAIGRELELPASSLRVLARAALLHDVGKLGIPDAILRKEGALDADEWVVMKRHPDLALDLLAKVGGLAREQEIIRAHHERLDGSGYPRGLVGEEIPLEARIIAVADTYDVVLTGRAYRPALSPAEAEALLIEEAGRHLYRPAVDAILHLIASRLRD